MPFSSSVERNIGHFHGSDLDVRRGRRTYERTDGRALADVKYVRSACVRAILLLRVLTYAYRSAQRRE